MTFNLPNSVASPQDLMSVIVEVHDYARWYQHEIVKSSVGARVQTVQPVMSASATGIIREWAAAQPLSQESLAQLIAALENCRQHSPTITITLAAPAPRSLITELVQWCRSNLESNILVTIQFNATILGGMVVRYGSTLFDWSFRRQLLANRQAIPEILHRV